MTEESKTSYSKDFLNFMIVNLGLCFYSNKNILRNAKTILDITNK